MVKGVRTFSHDRHSPAVPGILDTKQQKGAAKDAFGFMGVSPA